MFLGAEAEWILLRHDIWNRRYQYNIVLLEIIQYKVDIIIIRIGRQCVAAVMGSGNNNH